MEKKNLDIMIVGHGKVHSSKGIIEAIKASDRQQNIVILETEDPNTVYVNGEKYIPIEQPSRPNRGYSKFVAMASMLNAMSGYGLGGLRTRELPKNVDIIKEYGLIQLKKSNLSKWERDQVVHIFERNYIKSK